MHKVLRGGAYHLSDLDGNPHDRAINGRFLKKATLLMYGTLLTKVHFLNIEKVGESKIKKSKW